ncbi:helix-turn-helix domain-containing protein [Brachybacterium sp. AOP43-C2-M15]|uniref:helix-turn-helix domain-containing protein n=1 Tax=Brachybacterium sp. AOP43-C2-M15 TaxID=3457661 RepID=UPI004034A684
MPKEQDATTVAPPVRFEETFARELHRRRELSGISQAELARRAKAEGLHIWQSAIGRIETGDRQVTLNEALVLASILGADLAEMADYAPIAEGDALDPAGIATERAREAALAGFRTVYQAWERLEAATTEARGWIDRAIENELTLAPEDEHGHNRLPASEATLAALTGATQIRARRANGYVLTIAHLETMAEALERFLDDHSEENMRPIVDPVNTER